MDSKDPRVHAMKTRVILTPRTRTTQSPGLQEGDHQVQRAGGTTVTGVHQGGGKGCGGWPGLATGILTLGGLGLVAWAGPVQAQATFCDRTPAVRSAILVQISGITACEDVTEAHLNGITELALNSRGLSRLQGNDFAGLSSLESLNLKSNFLSSLDADIFAGLSSLKLLYLHDNHLSSLDADIFAGLANLQQLYLYSNALNSLPAGIFAGLANLEKLVLNNNSLSSLPAGIFADLANLEELFLYLNHLSSPDADIFAGLSSLKLLHLSDNSLNSLPAGIFAGLANLQQLSLDNNSLNSLGANIFAGLANLQQLSLDNNSLNSLGANIFAGLANLQWLYLYDNSLSSLDAEIFAGLANLQRLYLSNNSLSSLDAEIFAGLANLQWLFLNSNSLNSLPEEGIFAGLANLQRLYLHNNGLECLPRSMPWSRVNGRAAGGNLILLPMLPDCFGVSLGVMPTEVEEDNGGESITVTATLSAGARPTSVVTKVAISVVADTASEGTDFAPVSPFTITIPSGSESATETFTLTTMADGEAETGGETVVVSGTSTESYWSVDHRRVTRIVDASDATVTIKDALVNVQATMLMLTVGEGSSEFYTLVLNTDPTVTVTITPGSSNSGVLTVSPASLTFTPSNWNTARTVSVTAMEDADGADETVTVSHSVSGIATVTAAAAVTVTVDDDEVLRVGVQPASVSTEEGETATYTLVLDILPTGAVTITPGSSDSGAVSVSPASLTFTPSNWDTPRTVSVTAVQDDDTNNETVTVSHSIRGYGTVTAADSVTVSVTDDDITQNDTAGVSVEPTSLRPVEGEMATYTVALNTQPAANVTITPGSSDSGAVSVEPVSLTFTPSNWDTPRTVSVTAVEDDDTNNETVTVSHSVSGYDAVTAADSVTVMVTDDDITQNDTAGVSVEPTSLRPVEGEMATYTVALNTQPAANVTITPGSSDSGAVSVEPVSLTFTPSNWDTPRTVSVTAVEDDDTNNETVTVSHSVSGYGAVTAADSVTVTVTDDDTTQDDGEEAREAKAEAEAVLEEVVLPEVMQQLTAQTTEVIVSRLNTIASGSPSAPVTISLEEVLADTVAFLYGERDHLKNGSLEWRQAVSGRDFALPLSGLTLAQGEVAGAQEHPFSSLAVWGGADYSSYGNTIEGTEVDGNGFSGVIGMDLQPTPQLVSGLALTTSRWGLDYETDATTKGTYEIGVTMVNPYVNWLATDQLSLWATFGYGRGEVDHNPEGDAATTRTDSLTSWAGGLRFEVLPGADPRTGEGSPMALAFKVDGATSSFLETQVQLARLAAEVSRSFAVESGRLTTALELGWSIRSVSGQEDLDGLQQRVADKKDGGGAELAGHFNWRQAEGSVSATVDTRVLLGGGDRREWGMGGQLRFAPSRRSGEGEGLSLTLQPAFGVTGTRLNELWSLSGDGDPAMSNDLPGGRLDARLSYSFRHGNGLLTPYTEVVLEETASTYGAGLRYGLNPFLELDLKGAHRRRANGNDENRLFLQVRSDL